MGDKRHPNKIYWEEKEKAKNKAAWEKFTEDQVAQSRRDLAEHQKKTGTGCVVILLLPLVAIGTVLALKIYFT